ncbi:MAG: deoxyribose-phosphate aldolase [Desulfuromonadaceae bacterium]|nr:deoxyribose-phosphate aldolase [Desulfuromonas sp.]MDY0185662.1 deoxyribose-phosphate aldolase [Desulfuromonadaceae bacterium]
MLNFPPSMLIEHTLLNPMTRHDQINALCEEAVEYGFAAVCIPPTYVATAVEQLHGSEVKVCTVVGFPTGFESSAAKAFAAHQALLQGADEIDMVVQQGWIQDGRYADVEAEIRQVKQACGGAVLKVIIECCNLSAQQKRQVCTHVVAGGADYVKTSTGTAAGGATVDDVELLRAVVADKLRIKAAGGIRTLEQLEALYRAGATRIGTSQAVAIVSQWLKNQV